MDNPIVYCKILKIFTDLIIEQKWTIATIWFGHLIRFLWFLQIFEVLNAIDISVEPFTNLNIDICPIILSSYVISFVGTFFYDFSWLVFNMNTEIIFIVLDLDPDPFASGYFDLNNFIEIIKVVNC